MQGYAQGQGVQGQGPLMIPVYMGSPSESGKNKSSQGAGDNQYDGEMKRLLQALGIEPPDEDEEWQFLLPGQSPSGYNGVKGSAMLPYSMPSSMKEGQYRQGRGVQDYSAQQIQQLMRRGKDTGYPGDGDTSVLNVNYFAPDGTAYNMSVMTGQENRGAALYNMLSGLYGLMMAEGQSSRYKGSTPYAGRGAKGAKGGKGGK